MYRIPDIAVRLLNRWIRCSFPREHQHKVFLTFDDGPDLASTPKLLALLASFNARASFFLTGSRAAQYPHLVQMIREKGHAVHLHSWNHEKLRCWKPRLFRKDLRRCHELLGSNLYRPPYGIIPLNHLCWCRRNGYRILLWNVNTRDYRINMLSEEYIARRVGRIKPGDVVLLHDKAGCIERTLFITGKIMQHLSAKMITFERIL